MKKLIFGLLILSLTFNNGFASTSSVERASAKFTNEVLLAPGASIASAVSAAPANTLIRLAPYTTYDLGTTCNVILNKSIAIIGAGSESTKVTCNSAATETTGFEINADVVTTSDVVMLKGFAIEGDDFLSAILATSSTATSNLDYDNIIIDDVPVTITDDEGATITAYRTNVHGMTIKNSKCSVTSSAAGSTRCYYSEFDDVGGSDYANSTSTYIENFDFYTNTTSGATHNRALDFYHKTASITSKRQSMYARNGRAVSAGTVAEACKVTNDMNGVSSGGHEVYMDFYADGVICDGASIDFRDGSFLDAQINAYLSSVTFKNNKVTVGTSSNDGNPVLSRFPGAFNNNVWHFYPTVSQSQGTINELITHTLASGDTLFIHPPTITEGIGSWILSGAISITKGLTIQMDNGATCKNYLEEGSNSGDIDIFSIETAEHVAILDTCIKFNSTGANIGITSTASAQGGSVDIKNYYITGSGTGSKTGAFLLNFDTINIDGAVMDLSLAAGSTSADTVKGIWMDFTSAYSSPPASQIISVKNVTAVGVNDENTSAHGLRIRDSGFTGTITATFENNDIRWSEITGGTTYGITSDGNGVTTNIKSGFYSGTDGDITLFNTAVVNVASSVRVDGTYGSVGTLAFNADVDLVSETRYGHAGVRVTHNGDGAIAWTGVGNGSDENVTWDLDTVSNTLGLSSTTSLTNIAMTDIFITSTKNDSGWTVQSAANQACTTTCTSAAVMGFDSGTALPVSPTSALADACLCAGAS